MPHHAKHHASENRRAIERSLVIRKWCGVEPRRGSVMIVKNRLIPRPTLGSVDKIGGLKQKHKKQPFGDASASRLSLVLWHG